MVLPRRKCSQLAVAAFSSLVVLAGCTSPFDPDGPPAERVPQAPEITFIITLEATDRCLTVDEGKSQFATPLEDELWGIAGVRSTGTGGSAGLAYASVTFASATPWMAMLDEVEQAIVRVAERFPKDAQARLYVSPFTSSPPQGMLPAQCLREGAGMIRRRGAEVRQAGSPAQENASPRTP
ncbi:MAG: hypothetical protein OXG82_09760 [Gammaproteobacteria bacterium]|nr:hypothetical protein [Gammaproteobacteria bacterium]